MTTVHIPASIEDATSSLNGLGALLQAKEWERAAIVYAFTEPAQGQRTSSTSTGSLTITGFAALGITGLKSDRTVRQYRAAWESAMEDGAPDVKPGDDIAIPNLPWPPGIIDHERGSHATTAEVDAAIVKRLADPAARAAIVKVLADDPALVAEAEEEVRLRKWGPPVAPAMTPVHDPNFDATDHALKLGEMLKQERDGVWTASAFTESALMLLELVLKDRADRKETTVFDDIDALLATHKARV